MELQQYTHADQLPEEWDLLAENYFQKKVFLSHAEKYNPCSQRYYLCTENKIPVSGAVVYTLRLDILTYSSIKSPLKMHICGIPCSVSSSGIFGKTEAVNSLKELIREIEKGFLLFLNLTEKPENLKVAFGKTLPTIMLKNRFEDWNGYLSSLRSGYRRRLKLINNQMEGIEFMEMPCNEFNKTMYGQYLEVYNRSKGKLEKLEIGFFQHLPAEFVLTTCLFNKNIAGWNLALKHDGIYYFFLGGIDYRYNKTFNTYFRLLSNLVKNGIEQHADVIELGQTAETAKMRMGGKAHELWMEASHSNAFINKLLKWFSPLLEYKFKPGNNRVNKFF